MMDQQQQRRGGGSATVRFKDDSTRGDEDTRRYTAQPAPNVAPTAERSSSTNARNPSLDRSDSHLEEGPLSMMRKVRSLDCIRRVSQSGWSLSSVQGTNHAAESPSSSSSGRPSAVASKFSRIANRKQYFSKGRRFSRPRLCSESSADETDCGKAFSSSLKSPRSSSTDVASILAGSDVLSATGLLPRGSPRNDGLSDLSEAGGGATDDSEAPDPATQDIVIMGFVLRGALPRKPISVGCLSVLALLFATLTNLAWDVASAQVQRLDDVNPMDFYDALSPDVIVPPFRYKRHQPSEGGSGRRPRLGLGTAAIGSLTDALSPILPFTGGMDLRREEHWNDWNLPADLGDLGNLWRSLWATSGDDGAGGASFGEVSPSSSALADADSVVRSVPRGGGQGSSTLETMPNISDLAKMKQRKVRDVPSVLAAPEPFVPTRVIADLTLSDLTEMFRYAIEGTREGFDRENFLDGLSETANDVARRMDEAVAKSRGDGVKMADTTRDETDDSFGNVDALRFCAAMRLFAEWRIVRQVPEGYKGYAVGMGLGHKDVVQNVAKIEGAVHGYIRDRREYAKLLEDWSAQMRRRQQQLESDQGNDDNGTFVATNKDSDQEIQCPTLRELLLHEIDTDVHPTSKLPRLREKSAGMGLLWVRRQLQYQTVIFANILRVPRVYPNSNAAVSAAYSEVYDKYHGWAVQKIFNYSFQAAPEAIEICKFMNPRKLKEVKNAANAIPVDRRGVMINAPDAEEVVYSDGFESREEETRTLTVSETTVVVEERPGDAGGRSTVSTKTVTTTRSASSSFDAERSSSASAVTSFSTESITVDSVNDDEPRPSSKENDRVIFCDGDGIAFWTEVGENMTRTDKTKTASDRATKADQENRSDDKNPLEKFGAHIVHEWDKLGREVVKLGNNVGEEWERFGKHVHGEWDKLAHHVGGEWDKLAHHVGGEWDKLAYGVVHLFGHKDREGGAPHSGGTDVRGGGRRRGNVASIAPSARSSELASASSGTTLLRGLRGDALEDYVSEHMLQDAHSHIEHYLTVANPLLDDLGGLFKEMNMDDPTKV